MNKIDKNKLVLPTAIVLGCLILGGVFYMVQANKQKSIEKQQQIELQAKTETDQAKAEQDKRDYIAKRKIECLAIYKSESEKWNNILDWHYIEPSATKQLDEYVGFWNRSDVCEIICKDTKTGEEFSKYY